MRIVKVKKTHKKSPIRWFGIPALLAAVLAVPLLSGVPEGAQAQETRKLRKNIEVPNVDQVRGRRLFVTKGCVICHSMGGVGGRAAPELDAAGPADSIDVLGFVSRLMVGMPAMIELQSIELGYQIALTPDEIADLAGFVSDADAQVNFSREEVPEPMRDWILNEPYWDQEEWPESLPEEYPDFPEDGQL
jgi:mono/diheme cytochrome c family protein